MDAVEQLFHAARNGDSKAVRELLLNPKDIPNFDSTLGQALCEAAWRGHRETVELLLDHGADFNLALRSVRYFEIMELLLDRGADVNACSELPGHSALSDATHAKCLKMVELLLDYGVDVNAQCYGFGTSLVEAVYVNHIGLVSTLLDHGANINAHGGSCNNALQMAVTNIRGFDPADVYAMVDLLLTRGADVTIQPIAEDRRSLLHHAIEKTNGAVVRRLWDAGAGIHQDTQDASGLIPLHTAVNEKDAEIVEFLLERGASPNSTDIFEESPLKSAILARSSRIVDLLLPTARVGLSSISASDWRSHFNSTDLVIIDEEQICSGPISEHYINVFAAIISGHGDIASYEMVVLIYDSKMIW